MKITKLLIVTMTVMLVFPCLAFAYGEGTTQGAVKSGIDSGKICRCENLEQVRQGYKWSTRPEAMKKSPYEIASNFWDAEQSLLTGYEHGTYTKEEMTEIFQWLKTNKFFISDVAMEKFNEISGVTVTKSSPQTKTTSSAVSTPQTTSVSRITKPRTLSPAEVGEALLKRAKELYQQHPNRSRLAIADKLYREFFTPEQRAQHGLIERAYAVDRLDNFLERAERERWLPPRKERDISKLKKNK